MFNQLAKNLDDIATDIRRKMGELDRETKKLQFDVNTLFSLLHFTKQQSSKALTNLIQKMEESERERGAREAAERTAAASQDPNPNDNSDTDPNNSNNDPGAGPSTVPDADPNSDRDADPNADPKPLPSTDPQ